MPRYIVKIKDKYLEWSTVVDAPVTYGLTLEEFKIYYKDEYGNEGLSRLNERLERVEKTGCSALIETLNEVISYNRAGENEKNITMEEIYERYCKN